MAQTHFVPTELYQLNFDFTLVRSIETILFGNGCGANECTIDLFMFFFCSFAGWFSLVRANDNQFFVPRNFTRMHVYVYVLKRRALWARDYTMRRLIVNWTFSRFELLLETFYKNVPCSKLAIGNSDDDDTVSCSRRWCASIHAHATGAPANVSAKKAQRI